MAAKSPIMDTQAHITTRAAMRAIGRDERNPNFGAITYWHGERSVTLTLRELDQYEQDTGESPDADELDADSFFLLADYVRTEFRIA